VALQQPPPAPLWKVQDAVLGYPEEVKKEEPMKTILALALLAIPCFADEVVLKDGRTIEFRSIEDMGDTYTIITPEGARSVVKRADVTGFTKTEPAVPLTGATMSFGKGKLDSVDLLKRVEDKDFLSGLWKLSRDGSLQCETPTKVSDSCFQVRYAPGSEEYNLTLVIERIEGDDNIGVTFPVPGGRQCQFFFDIDMGKYSCILTPGSAGGPHVKASTPVPGRQFVQRKLRTVVLMVRKAGLVVQVDGKDVSTFRSDWSKMVPIGGGQARDAFAVSALTTGIRVSKMTVTVQR
jgi:hypothetical protein